MLSRKPTVAQDIDPVAGQHYTAFFHFVSETLSGAALLILIFSTGTRHDAITLPAIWLLDDYFGLRSRRDTTIGCRSIT